MKWSDIVNCFIQNELFLQLSSNKCIWGFFFTLGRSSYIIQTKIMCSFINIFYIKIKFDSSGQTGNVNVWSSCRSDQMGHHFKHAVCFSLQRCFWILVGPGVLHPHAKRCASWMKLRCSCRSRCNALSAVCVSALPAGQTATPARHVRRAYQLPPSYLGKMGTCSSIL